jgi:hypothetical protein
MGQGGPKRARSWKRRKEPRKKPTARGVLLYSEAGAYTTIDPSHITISSDPNSNQGDAALETLFHEASHTIFQKVLDAMGSEARAQNKLYDRGWQGVPEILDKDWKPYLEGRIDMSTAIKRLIVDYGVDAPTKARP